MPKLSIPWFYCPKNRVWNRRACKHSACARAATDGHITRLSTDAPKDRP